MKKTSYALIGLLLMTMMMTGSIVSVRGTTYNCTGVVGADATWKVKTVHEGALTDIFSVAWSTIIQLSFGTGAHLEGAKMKSEVTYVDSSYVYNFGLGPYDICLINSSVWYWTTSDFADVPDATNVPSVILMDPDDLTAYCQVVATPPQENVSYLAAIGLFYDYYVGFLNALPVEVDAYLSELVWDNDFVIQGTTVTHNAAAGYAGYYLVDCVESWRYSSSYGTFLGYKLVHNNGTTAYESELVTPSAEEIPGFNLLVLSGVSLSAIICVIFVIMKKRK